MAKQKTHEEYVEELKVKKPYIEVIGTYINAYTKITHKCLTHNIVWDVSPHNILKSCGCELCAKIEREQARRKTHDEYVKELKINNSQVEVVDKYINSNTKIKHHCLIHDVYWDTTPVRALKGCGCPKCHKERLFISNTRTHEEYLTLLNNMNINIEPLEPYITCNDKIKHRCNKHNIVWDVKPDNILRGYGCSECLKEKITSKNTKTHEQYVEELKRVKPEIEVIGTYINTNTPIMHQHKLCGYTWSVKPTNVLTATYDCPKCTNHIQRTHETFVKEVQNISPNIEVLGKYTNTITPILYRCKIHNYEWTTTPSSILAGGGCKICANERTRQALTKSHEQYVNELKEKNFNIQVIDVYSGSNVSIKHRCLRCGLEWDARPANILIGTDCPHCNCSRGEKSIEKWLVTHNINYTPQKKFKDCKNIRPLPFDFYLPKYNKAIEYDGKQHFVPIEHYGGVEAYKQRIKNDEIKNKYCKDKGIDLLRIPYTVTNIEEELNNFLFA